MLEVLSSCHCKYCKKPLTTLKQMSEENCGSDECIDACEKEFEESNSYWNE